MELSVLYDYFLACGGITTDSRNCPENSMFVALKGENFNGNAFAEEALRKGCRYAVVDEPAYAGTGNPRILLVDDCLRSLQRLANCHRRRLKTRIIGITGTNGKTTTKELMAEVLKRRFNLLYTQGNLNNSIGVPLTLLRLKPEHELAVVEMGASHPGDIRELVEIAEPDYGIITNVGKAHLQGFGSFEGVIRTKGELYDYLRGRGNATIFIQNENPYLNRIAHDLTCVRYGQTPGLFVIGRMLDCSPYLKFCWEAAGESHEVTTRLVGSYNLDNALAAVAVGRYFGVDDALISGAIAGYVPQNSRSQLVKTASNELIVDAYNANPTSMAAALENFRQMPSGHKMVVLGDMRELGASSREEHQRIVDLLAGYGFERVCLVGGEFASVNHTFEQYRDVDEVMDAFRRAKPEGFLILVKGSNGMKLNRLPDCL